MYYKSEERKITIKQQKHNVLVNIKKACLQSGWGCLEAYQSVLKVETKKHQ